MPNQKPTKMEPRKIADLHKYLTESRSIKDAWGVYHELLIPKTAGPNQVRETRKAFYAAADWTFKRMLEACDDEEDGERLLEGWTRELAEHTEEILRNAKNAGRRGQ